jgi:hypothetical protein
MQRHVGGGPFACAFSFVLICALSGCKETPQGDPSSHPGAEMANFPAKQSSLPPQEQGKSLNASPQDKPSPKPLPKLSKNWGEKKRQKLGPAGPSKAIENGVLFVTRDNRLLLAERKDDGDFVPISEKAGSFDKYGRGPSATPTHAYWTSEDGRLFRGDLVTKTVEPLHPSARPHTRTSSLHALGRDLVVFIKEVDQKPMAHLWAEKPNGGGEVLRISPEGSTATSVVIVPGSPHPKIVVLAGRTGMSPIHVRRVRPTSTGIELDQDEVVWIAPGSHVMTEIHALGRKDNSAVAFLPTAKDFNDFGLAQLSLSPQSGQIPEPDWRVYPNGLDPAPVATEHFCGEDYVLYARPSEERPYAPQELHLAPIKGSTPGEGEIIARARAFGDLSVAKTPGGATAVWTAGSRTWGMAIPCPKLNSNASRQ